MEPPSRAYDGFYLALAERHEAEFWTTDQRLKRSLEQVGADLAVHSIPSVDQESAGG